MPETKERLVAIDWLRGFVMIVMAVRSRVGHLQSGPHGDRSPYPIAAFFDRVGRRAHTCPRPQFFTRWITHLCAPTFLFLSGTSLALSTPDGRRAASLPSRSIAISSHAASC